MNSPNEKQPTLFAYVLLGVGTLLALVGYLIGAGAGSLGGIGTLLILLAVYSAYKSGALPFSDEQDEMDKR